MKKGWQIKKLGELFDITSSKRVFESDWKSEGVPFYRAREIVKLAKQGFVNNELFISEEMFKAYSKKYGIPSPGDIMVTGVGTLGICYVVKENDRFYFKDGNIIWLKKLSNADSRFIEYAFQSDYLREQIDDSVGATVGTYTIIKAKSTRVLLPPLPEQQRIGSILDEAFEKIATAKANAEKNLQNARALFESHLNDLFTKKGKGWVEKRLMDVCEKITDGTHQTPTYFDEGVVFLSSRNVTSGVIDWDRIKYIDTKQHLEMHKRVAPRRNDILLAKNGTTGVAAIVDRDTTFDIYVSLALLRARPLLLPRFLLNFINSPAAKVQFNKRLKGVGVPNLHLEEIREVFLAFPPDLKAQERVVEKLDALRAETQRLEAIYRQKLAALEALKKSLLDQAFSGGL